MTKLPNRGTFTKGQTRAHYPKGRPNPKLSETRKKMFAEGKLVRRVGELNPSFGKKATAAQLNSLAKGWASNGKGELARNWQGGKLEIQMIIRRCERYYRWRSDVFERDNWTCQTCRIRGTVLNAHHIKELNVILKENNIRTFDDAIKCGELWSTSNGVTLCHNCHQLTKHHYSRKGE